MKQAQFGKFSNGNAMQEVYERGANFMPAKKVNISLIVKGKSFDISPLN